MIPDTIGKVFSCDVVRHENQKIIILLDSFSSFMVAQLISNEKHDSLREALIQLSANYKNPDRCLIRVDDAPGFQSLRDDQVLKSVVIILDFGRNKNKKLPSTKLSRSSSTRSNVWYLKLVK